MLRIVGLTDSYALHQQFPELSTVSFGLYQQKYALDEIITEKIIRSISVTNNQTSRSQNTSLT